MLKEFTKIDSLEYIDISQDNRILTIDIVT